MTAMDFDGDGTSDLLVLRQSDGTFAKWYSTRSVGPDFAYQGAQFLDEQAGPWGRPITNRSNTVSGRVVFNMDCSPVVGARIRIWDYDAGSSNDLMAETFTSSDGRYVANYTSRNWDDPVAGSDQHRPDIYVTVAVSIGGGFTRVQQSAPPADDWNAANERFVDLTVPSPLLTPALSGACQGRESEITNAYNRAHSRLSEITDASLRGCMRTRHYNGDVECENDCPAGEGGYVLDDLNRTIHICMNRLPPGARDAIADTILHEWAHTCGWDHGEGKGVPEVARVSIQ
jgi:hypothetical protein